ncbi:GNAT family N-acetyltransferase [uncultured Phycicoccus sp.]|uniref:GNAT family N-acetyltransferase n=1 Tax=uncultured Phycicoccus sp. TaxID=661422 RepID=UPI002623634D|nr:GNAT family N-acetyltransferase [uncultured Phycicoccus sp.]
MSTVRRLDSYEDLLEASGHHPVVLLDVGRGLPPPAWGAEGCGGRAVAFARRSDHGILGASVLGDAAAVEALVADPRVRHWFDRGAFRHLGRPRGVDDVVERHLPVGSVGGDWEWMYTRAAPPRVAGEDRVTRLAASARDELVALLTAASPRTHGQPFARPGQRWVGVHDDTGRLVACGVSEPSTAGTPTLAGIAVVPGLRGQGLGAAVTAELTRDAVARTGACALGMFSDNDGARRLYQRLGFTTAVEWRSRWREGALPSLTSG